MTETTVNTIPALTWNWLKMNDANLSFEKMPDGKNSVTPKIRNLSDEVTYRENIPLSEMTNFISDKNGNLCETGAGVSADVFFNNVEPTLFQVEKNCKIEKPIVVELDLTNTNQNNSVQIIHAKENSSVTIIFLSLSEKSAAGFEALRTYCIAEKNSHIHLIKVQLLGNGFTQIDDTGTHVAENAKVNVTQIMLGAAECYTGVAATLAGYKSSFNSDTAYLCAGKQKLDMNYVVRHVAKKTECKMKVAGTLRDTAAKTYRGSIDFIKGCSGSKGEETEETLLLSPTATNKSIPLILCGEEDVAGEHGASIGRLGEDILFYMQNRGISKKTAEDLMARAKIEAVANLILDCQTTARIDAFFN